MSKQKDKPPSEANIEDKPPPLGIREKNNIKHIVNKLSNRYELSDYATHLIIYRAHHLTEEIENLKQQLLLQGLDEEDLHMIHEFLGIEFEGEICKILNRIHSEKRLKSLLGFLN